MKINKFFLGLLGMAAFTFAACSDSDDDYSPATVSGSQVFFSKNLPAKVEISPSATSFDVTIERYDAAGAITVPLTSTVTAGSIFSVPNSVSFADGEKEAKFAVTYNPANIEYGRYDTINVVINDAQLATPYGLASYNFVAGVTDWGPWQKWNAAGTCTYTYANYWAADDPGLPFVYRHNTIKDNLYQFKISNWASGVDVVLDYDKTSGHVTVAPQFAVNNATYGDVLVADSYYYWFNVRGTDISEMSEDDYGRFDEENGYIYIPLAWYVPGVGTFGYNVETVTIDGYDRADLACEVAYAGKLIDAKDNYYVLANVALGADIEKAYVALVPGTPSEETMAAIVAGTYEPIQEVTESTQVSFDANELADGDYTFVMVPFYDDEALEAQAVAFTYSSGAKETWTLVGTGDFTYNIFFANEDEEGNPVPAVDPGLEIYQSDADATRFRITHWGSNVDFTFTWDQTTGAVNVPQQFVGYTHPTYGDVYVMEAADYNPDKYGSYSSLYQAESTTFQFCVAYVVEAGTFGVGYEPFKVTWNSGARAMSKTPVKNLLVRSLKLQPFNRFKAFKVSHKEKTVKSNLKFVQR